MAYTERETVSYGSRLGKAFKGIAGGFLMFIGGTILLFWNEGNFVKTQRSLNEAANLAQSVEDVSTVNPEINGKLIHATAKAETTDILEDPLFGIKDSAIALKRKVEYYQWRESSKTETRDRVGGSQERVTTYTYSATWTPQMINSQEFKDPDYIGKNHVWIQLEDQQLYAENVSFGAYKLPEFFIRSIGEAKALTPTPSVEQIESWNQQLKEHPRLTTVTEGQATNIQVHVSGSSVYFGYSPHEPRIGDVRVTFTTVLPHDISIIAKVRGQTFEKYITKNGKSVSRLEDGSVGMEAMFAHAHSDNKMMTWILRILGVVLVCAGLRGIFGILEALAKVIPLLGDIVGAGVGIVCTVFGVAWSCLWIAIAWITYRPLIGVPLLIITIAAIIWLKKQGKQRAQAAT